MHLIPTPRLKARTTGSGTFHMTHLTQRHVMSAQRTRGPNWIGSPSAERHLPLWREHSNPTLLNAMSPVDTRPRKTRVTGLLTEPHGDA